VIVPALAEGRWVVCDRFLDSSLAYQGAARGLGVETVLQVNRLAVDGRLPDRSLVIDVPVALATSRRCATPDRIEAEGDGFLARVAHGYHDLAGMFPERVRLVDGTGTPDEVHARVLGAIGDLA
jgi:dTMP kinase